MTKLIKHFLGCYLENEFVGVLTLGWGTQQKATIAKLFNDKNFCRIKFDGEKYVSDDLDTKDYYEIGKMCIRLVSFILLILVLQSLNQIKNL